jgi:hypothetical protein
VNELASIATDTAVTTRLLIDSGAIVGAPRVGPKKQWSTREVAVIRAEFPAGGINACLAQLPGRSAGAIYQKAANLGLRKRNRGGGITVRQRYTTSPQIDHAIIAAFTSDRPQPDIVRRLSATLGRPRAWINGRALQLGLVVPKFREGHWSARELEILREAGAQHPDVVRRKLKAEGYRRTSVAILVKRHSLHILREIGESGKYTATALAEAFGVDRDTVRKWAEKGWLAGSRLRSHSTAVHLPAHDRAWWQFTRKEVRDFVIENVSIVDFRRVDKFWLVDLLASDAASIGGEGR